MKDAQAQAQQAMGADHPGAVQQAMGSDQEAQIAYAQRAMKLQQSGVEAQGVIHAIPVSYTHLTLPTTPYV